MAQQTLSDFFRSHQINVSKGISDENLAFSVQHFARKHRKNAVETLCKFAHAGARAFIYSQAGVKVQIAQHDK